MTFQKGHPNYNVRHSQKAKEKMRVSKLGNKNPMFGSEAWNRGKPHLVNEKNPAWKGNAVTKASLHAWIRNHFPKKGVCELCKSKGKTEWSNKDHKYDSRERDRWQEVCRACHLSHDYKHLGRTRTRKSRSITQKRHTTPLS